MLLKVYWRILFHGVYRRLSPPNKCGECGAIIWDGRADEENERKERQSVEKEDNGGDSSIKRRERISDDCRVLRHFKTTGEKSASPPSF